MTENILIEFSSDTKGITTAEQALEQFANVDKEVKDQFDKTNKALKDRDTIVSNLSGGLGELVTKLQNADKAAAGAFGAKGLNEFAKGLRDNTSIMKLLTVSIGAASEKLKTLGEGTEEYKQLNGQIQQGVDLFKKLGIEEEVAEGKGTSLKTRLRELKAELANIDDPQNPRFIKLSSEAAELEDRIGDVNAQIKLLSSDTRYFDAGIQAVQGFAGAFAAAQGAMALFGAEDDEVQQTLLKVNAAMSILQGLQQVGAVLDKNSALNIFLLKTLRSQQAVETTAVAVAEGEAATATQAMVVADEEATVAQVELNTAMSLNPAGVLILALGTLVGLIKIFVGDTEAAAKAQEKLNMAFEEGVKTNDSFVNAIKQSRELNATELAKSNASAAALRANDILSLQEQLKQYQNFENSKVQAYINADNRLRQLNTQNSLSSDEKREKDALEKTVETFTALQRKRFDIENQLQIAQINDEAESFRERLKNHTAFVEASVLRTQEGSRAELVAQIAAIRARENEELKSAAHLPGEVAKIQAQADRDAQKVRTQIAIFDLNQQKSLLDARLQKVQEGSGEELKIRLDLLHNEQALEIAGAENNQAKIADIKAKYAKQSFIVQRDYNRKAQDDAANAQIADTNSKINTLTIAGADATNQQLLEAKEKLIEQEAQKERVAVDRSIDLAANKVLRIQAINDKELADKVALEQQKRAAEISGQENFNAAALQLSADRAKRLSESSNASFGTQKKALSDYYDFQIQLIDNASEADEERLKNNEINQKEFDTRELQRLNQKEALKTQIVKEAEAKRLSIQQAVINMVSILGTGLFDDLKTSYDNDLANVQDLANKKLITQQEADRRTRAIHKQQAILDREQALFNIAISVAQAIAKDLAGNKFMIPFDIATGIVETGLVLSKPLPKFRKGKIRIDGPGTETSDSIFAMLSKNESVINAEATKRYQPALEAINSFKFDEYLASITPKQIEMPTMKFAQFEMPDITALPKWAANSSGSHMDYDKLGKSMAKHMAKEMGRIKDIPGMNVQIDKNGISIIAQEGIDRTEYLNNKFSFKL